MENAEIQKSSGVPIGLPISAVILLILGLIANPLIKNNATEEQLARNVILSAIPFILIFAAIIITFMSLIWFMASRLNDRISPRIYQPIEWMLMGGIVFGILLMFQPWVFILFRVGFLMLLVSTLTYILWSHIRPGEGTKP